MKKRIQVKMPAGELQILYSPNWEYYSDGVCQRHLQLLFPHQGEQARDYPLILLIPGSAWHKQEMYNDIPQYAALAKLGFVVAAMEYRESELAPFPAQVEDVCHALAYIPQIAENFHIDTRRIFLMGNSSGAHIAMMAVLLCAHGLCGRLPPISGVIGQSGAMDLTICAQAPLPPWMKVRPTAALLGLKQVEGQETALRKASCLPYVTPDISLPPVLLIHGEKDPVVSVENSRALYRALRTAGHRVEYYELTVCAAHGGGVFYEGRILNIIRDFCMRNGSPLPEENCPG